LNEILHYFHGLLPVGFIPMVDLYPIIGLKVPAKCIFQNRGSIIFKFSIVESDKLEEVVRRVISKEVIHHLYVVTCLDIL
jgi:hypothetical protein